METKAHSAHTALLADGPREGESVGIHPGQTALEISERFDVDQGYTNVILHYAYESRTGNDPDTVVFTYRSQEQHTVTD